LYGNAHVFLRRKNARDVGATYRDDDDDDDDDDDRGGRGDRRGIFTRATR